MRFKDFIEQNTVGYHNDGPGSNFDPSGGAYLSSTVSGRDNEAKGVPGTDFQVPIVKKSGRIDAINKKKNPIYIRMQDGTQLFFTWDEFKRIKGKEPERGDIISVLFQRLPGDTSKTPSQIQSVEVQ